MMAEQDAQHDSGIPASVEPLSGTVTDVEELSEETRGLLQGLQQQDTDETAQAHLAPPDPEPEPSTEAAPVEDSGETAETPALSQTDDLFDRLRQRDEGLRAREANIKGVSDENAAQKALASGWTADRAGTLRQQVAKYIGSDDPEKIQAELHSLYEDLTLHVLDVPVDSDRKALSETAKVRRELETMKQKAAAEKAEREQAAARAEHDEAIKRGVATIDSEIANLSETHPFLEPGGKLDGFPSAGQQIWNVMSDTLQREGKELTLAEAADTVNQFWKQAAENFRPYLLTPGTPTGETPTKQTPKTSQRGTRTLTNARASEVPDRTPTLDPEDIEDEEERVDHTLALLRQRNAAADT